MNIVLATYKDPAHGLDWHQQTPKIEKNTRELLVNSELPLEFSIREGNIGRGADMPVTVVEILSVFGLVTFVIPETHKRIRESFEEWGRIRESILNCIFLLSRKNKLVSLPEEVLFAKSVEKLVSELNDDAVFVKHEIIHSIGSHEDHAGLMGFYFDCDGKQWRVVINGLAKIKLIEQI
ncbi:MULTISPECIES: hypothetical protein [Vibrio]|uniref:Uncharacterized protein n=2 Tax=Vibrio TaxID=662 RepID=A0A2N7NHR9_9VIBR|nr:hypothetical protein [Vibrio tasmaniensis]PMP13952.1 hypothetical protein BCS92_14885 [Vibrio tasmaniensis]TKG32167.1 hypothetical protein FC057_13035 [Vibrio tasmaniensis]TKG39629.1 hypothetical protein FC063_14735 [Vibrio tasmaniensis]TKG40723.1 hypothetical protein FC060_23710 [Vibrio tasmaniensis]TKG49959.1 hypothetical protein FC061_13325 [Vibrio tasmaniensis]